MEDDQTTDPAFLLYCKQNGIPYTGAESTPQDSVQELDGYFAAAEIQALVEMAVREQMQSFEQRVKNLIADQKSLSLLRTVEELRWRIHDLENRLSRPVDPRGHLPDLGEITKLHVQLFDNKRNPPKQAGKKRSTIANQLLKLYAWTCPKRDIAQYAEGTCGNFYIPMYVPNTAYARKRIGDKLDYLGVNDAKLVGCLTNTKYSKRQQPDQAAFISGANHLWLHIRGEVINCGFPRSAPDDVKANAAVFHWYWPEVLG